MPILLGSLRSCFLSGSPLDIVLLLYCVRVLYAKNYWRVAWLSAVRTPPGAVTGGVDLLARMHFLNSSCMAPMISAGFQWLRRENDCIVCGCEFPQQVSLLDLAAACLVGRKWNRHNTREDSCMVQTNWCVCVIEESTQWHHLLFGYMQSHKKRRNDCSLRSLEEEIHNERL